MMKTKNKKRILLPVIFALAVMLAFPLAAFAGQTGMQQGLMTKAAPADSFSPPSDSGTTAQTDSVPQPPSSEITTLAAGSDSLTANQNLTAGQSIISANGTYKAAMQSDGNFVVYKGTTPIFTTKTSGKSGTVAKFQADGNFVLYQGTAAVWKSGTSGKGGNRLIMQNDGNLVIYSSANLALWNSKAAPGNIPIPPSPPSPPTPPTTADRLTANQGLTSGQSLTSPNKIFRATMQSDGNFVVYNILGTPIFNTKTGGKSGAFAKFQSDGNFVLYKGATAIWNSRTGGKGGNRVVMQNDGNLVLYSSSNQALWNSKAASGVPTQNKRNLVLPNQRLNAGDYMLSANGQVKWIMQTDGNLVGYKGQTPYVQSKTGGNPGAYAVFQSDGNLVVYSAGGKALYATGIIAANPAYYGLGNDGILTVYH